jgi:hypothetical protein
MLPFDHPAFLRHILNDEKRCGVSCDDEAAFLSLQLIIGAADTVRYFSLQAKIVSNRISEKEPYIHMGIPRSHDAVSRSTGESSERNRYSAALSP